MKRFQCRVHMVNVGSGSSHQPNYIAMLKAQHLTEDLPAKICPNAYANV